MKKILLLLSVFCLSTNTIFANEFNYTYSQQIPEQTIPAQPQQYGYNYGAPTNNYNSYNQQIQTSIMVPNNLAVPFTIQGNYTSKTLTTNTRIPAAISNDVYYGNYLVFKRGTVGYLYPSYVNKAGRFGDQAKININSVTFRTIDGKEQVLSVDYAAQGRNVVYSASAGLFAKNKETELTPGTLLYGYTTTSFPLSVKSY